MLRVTGIREEGNILVIRVRGGDVVRAARECIWGTEVFSWGVGKVKIKLGEV